MADTNIDDAALDSLSVSPAGSNQERDPRQDAGQDASIAKRLENNPSSEQAKLDAGLDESMDASDPPASVNPGIGDEPVASSGYDPDAEKARQGS